MSILSKLQSLLSAANTATGESDTTITDAMQTLIDGYGQSGGLPSDITGIAAGTYTPASNAASHAFTHNLGCYPTTFYVGIMQNQDLSIDHFLFAAAVGYSSTGSTVCNMRDQTTNITGTVNKGQNTVSSVTNNSITIGRTATTHGYFRANVTYFWVAVKTSSSYVAP